MLSKTSSRVQTRLCTENAGSSDPLTLDLAFNR